MKDKDIQIEQMARIIDDRLKEASLYIGSMNNGKGYWIAQKLVEYYQPKLPKDSVVLSRENYERLVKTAQGKIANMKVTDFLKACTSIGIMVEAVSKEEQVKQAYEKGGKETADKIFAKIDKELCECTIVHNGGDYGWKLQGYERNDLTERLTKIAEQFGTSIEEYKKAAYRDHLLLKNYYGHAKEQTEKVQAAQKEEE